MKRLLFAAFCLVCWGLAQAQSENQWSSQDYDFYAGDFNGDGSTDILFVGRDPSLPSGIILSDGTAPTILGQTWASNYLGIPWSSGAYSVVVGDFNGDGKSDILLQSNSPGDSYLLLTDASGAVSGISQAIPAYAMGLGWTGDQHHLVTGDFTGIGRTGLYFQPVDPAGLSAIVVPDQNGQFTSSAPSQTWSDGFEGLNWSVSEALVYAGDFNGDGHADLLVQSVPANLTDNGSSYLSYAPNMNGVAVAQSGAQPFVDGSVQVWSRNAFGVDWSPLTSQLVVADFSGDGRADVLFQPVDASGSTSLLLGDAPGPIFALANGSLPTDVPLSADAAVLIAGNFGGGTSAGLLIQSTSRSGTNSVARNITAGIHPQAFSLPVLTSSSVPMAGTPPQSSGSSSLGARPGGAQALAATVTPTSAGRTAAQFSVTPTGGAAYNIPLWSPPGARGIEPHLALHYASGGPDGPMGPGWSLTGLSAIVRCGKTWASTSGAPGPISLVTSDDVCLDGNRLRKTSGTQLVAGSTYQTEIADFSLVTAYGAQGNGPQYFIVQGKDGRYYEYGNTADSRIFGSGATTPYAWALNKVRDRQGNNMAFTYTTGATVVTISKIQYTATPGTSNPAPYEVDFNYVTRTGGSVISKFVSGKVVTRAQQLDNVTVLASSVIVRKYQLGYAASATTNRPLLQTLQECGGSAGTDCIRPSTIAYQPGASSWATSATGSGLTGQYGFLTPDLNGDGIPDALYGKLSGSNIAWYARIATISGYGAEISTGATTSAAAGSQALVLGNLDGTGRAEFLAPVGSTLYAYKYNTSTGSFASSSSGAPSGAAHYVLDWDGDGLPDLVEYGGAVGNAVTVRRNVTAVGGNVAFSSTVQTVFSGSDQLQVTDPALPVDFNYDGRGDMLVRTFRQGPHGSVIYNDYTLLSNGFSAAPTQINLNAAIDNATEGPGAATVQVGDWNGDGCTDLVTPKVVFISDCTGNFTAFNSNIPLLTGNNVPYPYPMQLLDVDGDGQMDLVYPNPATNTLYVAKSTGSGIGTGTNTGISYATSKYFGASDRNGDGQLDLTLVDSGAGYAVSYFLHNAPNAPADLATTFSDGFGIAFSPAYISIVQGNYLQYTDAVFPEIDFRGPMYVVSGFTASDGRGSTYTDSFYYYGARLHLQGRGLEGFYAVRHLDQRAATYQYSYYIRNFPYTGGLLEVDTVKYSDGTTYLASTRNGWTSLTPGGLVGTSCSTCYYPYISEAKVYQYEPVTKPGGFTSATSNADTVYTYDVYGNLTDTKTTTTDSDSDAPASPFNGHSWITEIRNTITNDNSAANWCLGRPTTTTTTQTAYLQTALTRTVGHTIDYSNCRATVETVEPNDLHLKVITTFTFDSAGCGNTTKVSVVGLDSSGNPMAARNTTTDWATRCTFPEKVTNALNQMSQTNYNYSFGLPQSSVDPNGITTAAWLYDNFGRKTKETHADQTYTSFGYADCVSTTCWGLNDLRFLVEAWNYTSDGTQHGTDYKYFDGLDRQRYDELYRPTGVWTVAIFLYDSLGRKSTAYVPYSGSSNNGYNTYTYDVASRLTSDVLYTPSGTQYRSIGVAYYGQTIVITDPNSHLTTKVTDVAGKIRQITDDGSNGTAAGTTKYTYDSFGNLTNVLDGTNVSSSYSYNIRGFKISSADADAGNWAFTPDSLNELVSQLDAKGQTISFGYDLLGRMISRQEPEQATPTQWSYGASAGSHNIGRLASVTKPETPSAYTETYTYDAYGRVSTVTYAEDAVNYQFTYGYNTWGKIDTIKYPVSTSGFQFVVKDAYDSWGYLSQVKDNAAGTVFWSLGSTNDSNLPTSEGLGNGVTVSSAYTSYTNEITSRSEGTGGSTTNLQNLTYDWDPAGNLRNRQDHIQALQEVFAHDSMNRLTSSTLNGTTNLTMTYDAAGNITSKSDVGAANYVYDSSHKHAVKTAGSWSMTYDANGNMITRAGGSITWKSYNLPESITSGGSSAQFWYNADHQRWKQVANYNGTTETTHYIGGLLEVTTRGSGSTEYRHQIPAGSSTAIYTRRTDSTADTYYATSDHLGSADLIFDSIGNVMAKESFTPFGARRASNWSNQPPSPSDFTVFGNTTRKGFTRHEMIDSVNLVHMNGRVYDPYLGRFLSADTVVQNPAATESVNPYAYAWNDPLRYIDPSGHDLIAEIFGAILGIAFGWAAFYELASLAASGLAGAMAAGAIAGFVGGFVGALVATDSMSAALTAGLIGAATGALFAGVGQYADAPQANWTIGERTLAHGLVGCVAGVASSGNCGRGALSAAAAEYLGNQVGHVGNPDSLSNWGFGGETAKYALIGGITATIVGGDFWEGFGISAAGYLFNESQTRLKAKDFKLYLVAEDDTIQNKFVGHVFLGGRLPNGYVEAVGFYPQSDSPAALVEGEPGQVRDNTAEFKEALAGDPHYSFKTYDVDRATYYKAMGFMRSYDATNNYGLFTNSCVTAAFSALNYAGVTNSFIPNMAAVAPHQVYMALKSGF